LGGIAAVVVIDGVTFLAVALATAFVRSDTAPITTDADTGAAVEAGIRAGIRAVREHRSLKSLLIIDAFGQIAQGFFLVLFVVFVVERLRGGGVDVGVIRGSMAVGAIISAAIIGKFADRFGPVTLLTAGYFGMGVMSLVFWNAPTVTTDLWVYMVVFGLSGFPGASIGIGLFTAAQQFSPTGMLGRVFGMAGALDALARAAGSLIAGLLVSRVDLVVLLDTQSGIYIMCGVLAYVFIRDGRSPVRL
jgi:MFS family permease